MLLALAVSSVGPLVDWSQPGFERRIPTLLANVAFAFDEKSSRVFTCHPCSITNSGRVLSIVEHQSCSYGSGQIGTSVSTREIHRGVELVRQPL